MKKIYVLRNSKGEVFASSGIAQGQELVSLEEVEQNHSWIFEKIQEKCILIVKE